MRVIDTVLAASLLLTGALALTRPNHYARRPFTWRDDESIPGTWGVPKYFNFSMPIDHFTASDTRTFENEYWVNDTYYKQGGPVIVYDLGETGSTSDEAAGWISNEDNFVARLLERYNALGIAWQHRFYGYSLPFPLDENNVPVGGLDAFKYLTQEQAMEDVVYFAKNIEQVQMNLAIDGEDTLHPDKTPWIFVGGSYPGMRAALLRVRNPEIIYASWATSAPLQPDPDGSAYFNAALRSMNSNCTKDYHRLITWIDATFANNDQSNITYIQDRIWLADALATNMTDTLNTSAAANQSSKDIGLWLQNPLYLKDFMHNGPAAGLDLFCDYMETFPTDGLVADATSDNYNATWALEGSSSDEGILATHGEYKALDAFLAAYVWTANRYYQSADYSADSQSISVNAQGISAWGDIAYAWQNLYELGNFLGYSTDYQKYHPDDGILSALYTYEDARMDMIKQIPGIDPASVPQVTSYWAEYGGWAMQPSNVMFADGEFDPWRAFSPGSEEYEMGKPVRNYTTEMPQCGVALDGDKLFGTYYQGRTMAHCPDMGLMTSAPTSHSSNIFTHALDAWLPCFKAD